MKTSTRYTVAVAGIALVIAALCLARWWGKELPAGEFIPPDGANVTYFPALEAETGLPLVISASTEAGFMRPFVLGFQRHHASVPVAYIQSRSGAFFQQALHSCQEAASSADIYLSASSDQLVRLANEDCALPLPASIGKSAPGQAQWRDEVVAFTVEPAAFVFAKPASAIPEVIPRSHIALLEWLRSLPQQDARIGTYDIEESADGYSFAAADSRQAALYGRLLESLGRSHVRLYCCSNVMVDAVDRGDIRFAYNVQLSYAYAAQRAGSRISVVVPDDYQALQSVSLMVPKGARAPSLAEEFAAFLVSEEARALARQVLAPPNQPQALARSFADQLLSKASVTPVLLSLQDYARREQLIREWRQAMVSFAPQNDATQTAPAKVRRP